MRIAFVLPHFDEKQNSFSRLLEPILHATANEDIIIISSNRNYRGRFQHLHHSVFSIGPGPIRFLTFLVSSTIRIHILRRQKPFDIVHNIGAGSTLLQNCITAHACHAAWIARKKLYREFWRVLVNPLHLLVLLVESRNYRNPNTKVIAVSESLATELRHHHRIKDINVIPNAVRLDSVPADLRQEVRKKWGRNEQDFIITFAGNYFAHKGLGPLLRVLNRVDTPKNWYLHIFGKAQDEVRWQHLVRRQNLEHRVRFFGHVDRLSHHLVGCDVFCMPSKYESFGLVYIEAASIGLAIIATDVGVIRELISPEFSSFMLNHPPNEETMHERLLQLFRDRNLSQRFGADLCERAKAYRETDMVKATLEVYKKIIADSGRI